MSGLGEYAQKAEQYAKDHPDQVDKGVQRGEKSVEQDTDHRFDQQVGEGGEQIERHVGAERGQEGPQPDGGQRQEQVREDTENDDQEANNNHP